LNPRDPRTRSRQDAWVPPTTSTGPPTPATTAATGEAESLEKGPWVWPEPPAIQRPTLQRQASTPGSTRPRPQFIKRGVDRAADATTAGGGSPPGTGGGAVGGADGGAGRARKPQHACVCGRGSAVATADGGMDVARGARDGTDEGGAQDMGGGRPQGESSGSPDERPAGCVGSADTKHGPANTGDDGSDGGGGVAGEGTVGVARATGHLKTDVAASSFEPRIDAPAAAVHAASFGPGRRRLARGRQERVAGGN